MKRNATIVLALILVLVLLAACGDKKDEPSVEETTLTAVGELAPDFSVPTIFGSPFKLSDHKGKVVLVNWFATWCAPCVEEMPHLQKEVWEKFRGPDFTMVSIAREETVQIVQPFVDKHALSWPFAVDPKRRAFAAYAEAFIPRNHVVDREGRIVFQSQGFEKAEFAKMIAVIAGELDRD